MTTNKPMTGEQLDELLTVAVNMQRDAETDCNRPSAMFAYAVQVAVLELRKVRNDASALAAENAGLKEWNPNPHSASMFEAIEKAEKLMDDGMPELAMIEAFEILKMKRTPATDAFLDEVRAQAHKEGAHFVANRMLAAWEAGFIDDTAKNAADIARMILTSTEFMADAPEGDFDRSFADGVLEDIAAQLRKGTQS
ncbi:ead/Ea22-like family protein [Enterobacter roggenkampii]|uniref:ead/Ea22-like family protein n=1 Tax=Enterobacter cloacae complex TaxID=354276 RepID=UPI0020762DA3|nr:MULTISPECIES: ead/Ea22-like family protein [Enterobacter cloacae complex]MCM7153166.1 ead/Ea22-like family protein [Enterobacter roggenkampii]MDD9239913.1 ead/Ea22-like family protein [Enterobacter roggenkampii]